MIDHLRLLLALARPSVVVLLGLFTVTGMAQAGRTEAPLLLGPALFAVLGFLLFSVVVNDLSDEAIDRVNLLDDQGRPLVLGRADRGHMMVVAGTAAAASVAGAATVAPLAVPVVVAGLLLSAAYSLRPIRIADRGVLASLLLPLGYVAVPYLVGVLAVRTRPTGPDRRTTSPWPGSWWRR